MAAKNGHIEAKRMLGINYLYGLTTPKNPQKPPSCSGMLLPMATPSHSPALAFCLYGGIGTEKDFKQAFHWFLKAAEAEHADSQGMVGQIYFSGTGVQKDTEKAIYWWKRAAKGGSKPAQEIAMSRITDQSVLAEFACRSDNNRQRLPYRWRSHGCLLVWRTRSEVKRPLPLDFNLPLPRLSRASSSRSQPPARR